MYERAKQAAALAAAALIQDGAVVGLGTGSTAAYFIRELSVRVQSGLRLQGVASSHTSSMLAQSLGIPLLDPQEVVVLDLYVDGADEIDGGKQMIKGAGGAFLCEKILAAMSREMIVIVDETKLVSRLGGRPLPVELVPFGVASTVQQIERLGYRGSLRRDERGVVIETDCHHYIYDLVSEGSRHVADIHRAVRTIPGVVETGFFTHHEGRVIVGFRDGTTRIH